MLSNTTYKVRIFVCYVFSMYITNTQRMCTIFFGTYGNMENSPQPLFLMQCLQIPFGTQLSILDQIQLKSQWEVILGGVPLKQTLSQGFVCKQLTKDVLKTRSEGRQRTARWRGSQAAEPWHMSSQLWHGPERTFGVSVICVKQAIQQLPSHC